MNDLKLLKLNIKIQTKYLNLTIFIVGFKCIYITILLIIEKQIIIFG